MAFKFLKGELKSIKEGSIKFRISKKNNNNNKNICLYIEKNIKRIYHLGVLTKKNNNNN
jgi:hypothetical protein